VGKGAPVGQDSKQWEPMRLQLLGKVGEIVRVGEGKLTPPAVDPGEPRKHKPSG
jgi:hypothetical protein